MSAPRVVCPDCGMSTWKEGFGCVLPGCANHGVLTVPAEARNEIPAPPGTQSMCAHCYADLHGACPDSACPCECNR
jgi:hypothetical protein